MDADTIETCVLAAGDERCEVRQGPTDRNPESDANSSHSTSFFNSAPPSPRRHDIVLGQRTPATADFAPPALGTTGTMVAGK
jgi:hypothetical protein